MKICLSVDLTVNRTLLYRYEPAVRKLMGKPFPVSKTCADPLTHLV